jgi:predicted ATPase
LVLICVARPELLEVRPDWGGGKVNATTILLQPLSATESCALVDALAEAEPEPELRERVVAAAEGNPFFVEEMLAFALEAGGAGDVEVPPTIHALLAARLDRLEEEERMVIECAAVEGKVFHEGSVAALLARDAGAALAALVRKDLVRPEPPIFAGERGFRLRHLLIRDAAYDSIANRARRCTSGMRRGWSRRPARARRSTKRSSAITSSRRSATRSIWETPTASLADARRCGSEPRAGARSRGTTRAQP